jgi:hypothetical protein
LRAHTRFLAVPRVSDPVFMFCSSELVFGDTEGVGSRFHVLCSRTRFLAVPRASGLIFMFCSSKLVFGGAECVGSSFHILRPDSFSAVPRASDLVFIFFATGHVFGGAEGVGSRFHVLSSQTHFRRYRWRRVPFSCFARPDSFSAEPRASAPIFMFFVPILVFGDTEGSRSHFRVLRSAV